MTSKFCPLPLIIFLIILFVGCTKRGPDSGPDGNGEQLEVIVLFSPEGFYGFGYNDRFLAGIEEASSKYGFTYQFHVPDSLSDGADIYNEWLDREYDSGTEKSLFIFSSNIYEETFAALDPPAENSSKEVLIFDIPQEVPNAYSIHVATYGAGYYILKELCRTYYQYSVLFDSYMFHFMLANEYDMELKRTYDGCVDGIASYQVPENTTTSNTISYLYQRYGTDDAEFEKFLGYEDEEIAYVTSLLICKEYPTSFNFLIPIAGASNLGAYRYTNMHPIITAAMGMYLENSYPPISIVKCMDVVLDDFFQLWVEGGDIPKYTQYSLGSEGVKISISNFMNMGISFDEDFFQEAIIKEKEYYEKLAQ